MILFSLESSQWATHSSETEPVGQPVLYLCPQIYDQNKFLFSINYITSNIVVQQEKKNKRSNTVPLAWTVLFATLVPNV